MDALFSHTTALELLCTLPNRAGSHTCRARVVPSRPPGRPVCELVARHASSPVHVLVRDPSVRRPRAGLHCHSCSRSLPPGSVTKVELEGREVYVTSPALTFVQLAATLELVDVVAVGMALCSAYRLDDTARGGAAHREGDDAPFTTVEKLRSFVDAAKGMPGVSRARQALPYVCDGSRSPVESGLAMAAGMPARYGGFALGKVTMNPQVIIKDGVDAAGLRRVGERYPDIIVTTVSRGTERRAALDYDADSTHGGARRRERDQARRNEFQTLRGLPHFALTSLQAGEFGAVCKVFDQMRRTLGRRAARCGAGLGAGGDDARPEGWCGGNPVASDRELLEGSMRHRRVRLWLRYVAGPTRAVGTERWRRAVFDGGKPQGRDPGD